MCIQSSDTIYIGSDFCIFSFHSFFMCSQLTDDQNADCINLYDGWLVFLDL